MLLSAHQTLEAIEPNVSTAVCSAQGLRRVMARIAKLPPCWSWVILETRLGEEPGRVDLLLCADLHEHGASQALRHVAESEDDDLQAARGFIRSWLEPTSILAAEVPLCWLEYDVPIEGTLPLPFVQFCVDRDYPTGSPVHPLVPSRLRELVAAGLHALGEPEPNECLDTLQTVARSLPPGARFLHVGTLPHRQRGWLRAIAVMTPPQVVPWLARLGWEGDRSALERLVVLTSPGQDRLSVQVDLRDRVGRRVAIEYAPRSVDPADPSWARFMDAIVAEDLCPGDRAAATLAWLGTSNHRVPGQTHRVSIQRQLDVKLVLEPNGTMIAKAYLAAHPSRSLF